MNKRQNGFTLIELLVVTSITGILAATAYPSFAGPLYKARRTDGITALLELQMSQERWRSGHNSYASQAELQASATSSLRYYTLNITEADATGFSAVATGAGVQAGDIACKVLRVTVAAGQTHYTAGADESTSASNKRCWNL